MALAEYSNYVIDTSAVIDLQGYNDDTCLTTNIEERERAWERLITLITSSRVCTVYPAREEIKRNAPECYERLQPVFDRFIRRDTVELIMKAGEILDQFPNLVKNLDQRPSELEPADPYIIAYAMMYDVTVVTNEKPKYLRTPNNKSGIRIPDVCDQLAIGWVNLAEFAVLEQLLN